MIILGMFTRFTSFHFLSVNFKKSPNGELAHINAKLKLKSCDDTMDIDNVVPKKSKYFIF